MNHRNCCSLTCCALTLVGFGLSPLHAQVPTAAPAPPDAFTPAASADTASLIAQAQADQKAGRFAEALALLQPLSPPVSPADTKALQRAIAHVQFGWAESLLDSSPQQALPHYQSALDIDRTLRPAQSASDLNEIGIAYAKLRQYSKALVFFQQAQTLHQQAGDKAGEANTLTGMGNDYYFLHQYSKSIDAFQQEMLLYQQVGSRDKEAGALDNLAHIYNDLRQYSKALSLYHQALLIYRQVRDKVGEANTLHNMGIASNHLKSH